YGTLLVNITGAVLIGFISVAAHQIGLPVALQKLMLVGFLGSYTTFSSYILDSANLFKRQKNLTGLMYWLGSPILGFLTVELGMFVARGLG
ncbi:MAG: CrcB family protein, partial [Leptolyngbyaceae cyanobacterium SM2_3_12]|nr:CrcB family protein [Leptolyngbyaceae cyanobacterium SM2_3_12]